MYCHHTERSENVLVCVGRVEMHGYVTLSVLHKWVPSRPAWQTFSFSINYLTEKQSVSPCAKGALLLKDDPLDGSIWLMDNAYTSTAGRPVLAWLIPWAAQAHPVPLLFLLHSATVHLGVTLVRPVPQGFAPSLLTLWAELWTFLEFAVAEIAGHWKHYTSYHESPCSTNCSRASECFEFSAVSWEGWVQDHQIQGLFPSAALDISA